MKTAITFSKNHEPHHHEGHYERPARLQSIVHVLKEDGILDALIHAEPLAPGGEDIFRVHSESYYKRLVDASEAGNVWLDQDTYSTPQSLRIATEALGGLLGVTKQVAMGNATNGFAAVRPPGHHARPEQAMGFCLFANIAIAARWIQAHTDITRILILDFDVHHGNGTQEIFYDDPNVMYISTHQFPLYPGTGALEEIGDGKGEGATLNIPLPAGTGDETVIKIFETILRPRVLQFNPEFVLLSAGYDAHWRDPLGGLNITLQGFAAMTREIMYWAKTCAEHRLVGLLEGGYDLEALAQGVLTTLQLLKDPDATPDDPFGRNPNQENLKEALADYVAHLTQFHAR